jgi:hypothetical protein
LVAPLAETIVAARLFARTPSCATVFGRLRKSASATSRLRVLTSRHAPPRANVRQGGRVPTRVVGGRCASLRAQAGRVVGGYEVAPRSAGGSAKVLTSGDRSPCGEAEARQRAARSWTSDERTRRGSQGASGSTAPRSARAAAEGSGSYVETSRGTHCLLGSGQRPTSGNSVVYQPGRLIPLRRSWFELSRAHPRRLGGPRLHAHRHWTSIAADRISNRAGRR